MNTESDSVSFQSLQQRQLRKTIRLRESFQRFSKYNNEFVKIWTNTVKLERLRKNCTPCPIMCVVVIKKALNFQKSN